MSTTRPGEPHDPSAPCPSLCSLAHPIREEEEEEEEAGRELIPPKSAETVLRPNPCQVLGPSDRGEEEEAEHWSYEPEEEGQQQADKHREGGRTRRGGERSQGRGIGSRVTHSWVLEEANTHTHTHTHSPE